MALIGKTLERRYQINCVTVYMDDTRDTEVCETRLTYEEAEERMYNLFGCIPERTIQTPLGSITRKGFIVGKAYEVMPACPPEKCVYFVIQPVCK